MPKEFEIPVPILGGQGETIKMQQPDGTVQDIPVATAQFLALDQLLAVQQQIVLRLDSLHAHIARSAHPKSQEFQRCPTCMTQLAVAQSVAEESNGNAGVVFDPEGEVKEDIERAKQAEEETETDSE